MLRQLLPSHALTVKRGLSGYGLFAHQPIRKGQKVIEYVGDKVPSSVADRRGGKYLFAVNSRYTIIGTSRKNRARYINHSCKPNCEAREMRGHVIIYAIKPIAVGEELTYHYGKDYFHRIITPQKCRCVGCHTARNS